jgi:hypothetical protein
MTLGHQRIADKCPSTIVTLRWHIPRYIDFLLDSPIFTTLSEYIPRVPKERHMSTFQTMTSLVLLIFVLSVIVQTVQEFVKAVLNTKAGAMAKTVEKFMGNALTSEQVNTALKDRGLDITALEAMNRDDFRHLLDTIPFTDAQQAKLQEIFHAQAINLDQFRDRIAASYDAARAWFQREYTKTNKIIALVLSLVIVAYLNANIFVLYDQVAADQAAQQTIVGHAPLLPTDQSATGLALAYTNSRSEIVKSLKDNPILLRTQYYGQDRDTYGYWRVFFGLVVMWLLVSLGAPFWNDILKSLMGVNNALNTGGKKTT